MKYICCVFLTLLVLNGCEREITLDLPQPIDKLVVEGKIENGARPIVVLNKNFPYFGTFTFHTYLDNFVHNAEVTVSDGSNTVSLNEICFSELDNEVDQLFFFQNILLPYYGDSLSVFDVLANCNVNDLLGSSTDTLATDTTEVVSFEYCVYSFLGVPEMVGEEGKSYDLNINLNDGKQYTSTTTIPYATALDSIWVEQHPNPNYTNLWRLWAHHTEPEPIGHYYRYYTQSNCEPMYPGLGSVVDDLLTNGQTFPFPFDKAYPRGAELDFDTYGFFETGDSILLKWATIDKATYDFWRTLEFTANAAGPFGTTTQVISNVSGDGVLGVWGGYSVKKIYLIPSAGN